MELKVLDSPAPWYSGGLRFTCTQCGNCCSGPPGYVWITKEEIIALAALLKLSAEETVERYCRKIGGLFGLREKGGTGGQHDCTFLETHPDGRRTCTVYAARPTQCRTWPFWFGNLRDKASWDAAAVRCYGMNQGKHYSAEEIDALR